MIQHSTGGKKRSLFKEISDGLHSQVGNLFNSTYKKAGLGWLEHRYLKYFANQEVNSHSLFGHKTYFYAPPEYFHGLREIFVDEVYKQHLEPNAIIIDCGANIGLSIIYLKRLCASAKILAFEPDIKNFKLLQKNIESHELKDVVILNEAVWIENTMMSFAQEGTMSSKLDVVSGSDKAAQVKASRLRDFIDKPIDFLKIDIEGAEYEVLKDIADRLHLVNRMFVEFHGHRHEHYKLTEIFNIFTNAGFFYYIKEAQATPYPFLIGNNQQAYDTQLNIFCFRTSSKTKTDMEALTRDISN